MVYVDDMTAEYRPPHAPGRRYVMCHMIADTDAELFEMAARIGVKKKWFQGDHFDICKSKREQALQCGALPITWRQASEIMHARRVAARKKQLSL